MGGFLKIITMEKLGIKIFLTKRSLELLPSLRFSFFKGYPQNNGKYYPNEYVLCFSFLVFNIEIWSNKFWEGLFKINL